MTEIRMYIAEKLLYLVLCIAPIEHKDGHRLIKLIKDYAEEVLIENNIPYEK
jgi:hypothetical protein